MSRRDFPEHFRAVAAPRIRRAIEAQGFLLALNCIEFGEAVRRCWAVAVDRGALHLPDDLISEMRDWISRGLLDEMERHEESVAAANELADRVAREWAEHEAAYAAWEAGLTDLDAWEWA